MKRLIRLSAPGRFGNGVAGKSAPRKEWYSDLYKADGKTIKDRWNSVDQDETRVSAIRRSLAEMSGGLCAWCEKVLEPGWHVDHLLPKMRFPLASYYPDNFLPACAACNYKKDTLIPQGLIGKTVVDPVLLTDYPEATPFVKEQLYPTLTERLVDPSFDDPEKHIEFVAAALSFRGLTKEGVFTVGVMFSEKEDVKQWSKLHDWVHDLVKDLATNKIAREAFDRLVSWQIGFLGQPTLFNALVAHWESMLIPVVD